jgi:ribosomal protein S4E
MKVKKGEVNLPLILLIRYVLKLSLNKQSFSELIFSDD